KDSCMKKACSYACIATVDTAMKLYLTSALIAFSVFAAAIGAAEPRLEVRQLTTGPLHHFFGYIGHVQNIPWNKSGRYILALRTGFQDRMPRADDVAEIVLLDTTHDYEERVVERTRAWNPQQGTM